MAAYFGKNSYAPLTLLLIWSYDVRDSGECHQSNTLAVNKQSDAMSKTKKINTPGQIIWIGLYRTILYKLKADNTIAEVSKSRLNPKHATRHWLEGMSRYMKENFSNMLCKRREQLGLTQQELAGIAALTVTAVATIERGEWEPNLDTATQLCWALDVVAGITPEDLV